MGLYARKRDISLFRSLNREIINDIIDVEVDVYKPILAETKSNLYGESINKTWLAPVRIHSLISAEEPGINYNEFGADVTQGIRFKFLRDDLIKAVLTLDLGDIIHWDNRFWELDHEIENQYYMKRNPDTNKDDEEDPGGWNVSLIFTGHLTRKNLPGIQDMQQGMND